MPAYIFQKFITVDIKFLSLYKVLYLAIKIMLNLRGAFNKFPDFLYRHLKLLRTLENLVCYCYTCYEMTDQYL